LKELLTSAPILKIVDPNKKKLICTDVCKEGLDGVLTHNGYIISFVSKKLKELERNYGTRDLKLFFIVHALKMWRHYLMGKKFVLRTDHSDLKYMFEQPTLNVRKTTWLEFLSEYDFNINHI
jgi:hypothetical protein